MTSHNWIFEQQATPEQEAYRLQRLKSAQDGPAFVDPIPGAQPEGERRQHLMANWIVEDLGEWIASLTDELAESTPDQNRIATAVMNVVAEVDDWIELEALTPDLFDVTLARLGEHRGTVLRRIEARKAELARDARPRVTLDPSSGHTAPTFEPDLVEGFIRPGSTVVLVAPPKTGKTFAMTAIALAVGAGARLGPLACRQAAVLYVAAEGTAVDLRVRRKAALAAMGVGPDDPQPAVHFAIGPVDLFAGPDGLRELVTDAAAALGAPIGLVVVDTLAAAIGDGDENSAAHAGRIHRNVRAAVGDAAVAIVHHVGHDGRRERGSSALRGFADALLTLQRDGDLVWLSMAVAKETAPVEPIAFRLLSTDTGWQDAHGRPVRSLTLRHEACVAPPQGREAGRKRPAVAPAGTDATATIRAAVRAGPVDRAELVRQVVATGASRPTVYRAVKQLLAAGELVESAGRIEEAIA